MAEFFLMRYFFAFAVILSFILSQSCAKRGFIDGGPKDTIAPKLLNSKPDNFSTNFSDKDIRLNFDEYVKLKDIDKQLIVSPPLNKKLTITPSTASKYINIRINDTLQPNTTYSFNFGQSIQDNNEGNPFEQFTYVMSTGTFIDSLTLKGRVKDAFLNKTDDFVSVHLYEINDTYNDSLPYKKLPRYVTNTLNKGNDFELKHLKPGIYKLVAIKDKNNNFKFDPKSEKIGFHSDYISIPNDTIYEVELFKEKLPFKILNASQSSKNKIEVGFEGDVKNTSFTLKNGDKTLETWHTKTLEKDTISIWFNPIETDSISLFVKNDKYEKTQTIRLRKKELDTLSLQPKTGILNFREDLFIKSTTPIKSIDVSKMFIKNKDSLPVKFTYKYFEEKQQIDLFFDKEPEQIYNFLFLPDAIRDVFESSNDSLKFSVKTKRKEDYGNLTINLANAKTYPIIVDVLNDKLDIKASLWVKDAEQIISFDLLEPLKYTLRFIYDTNKNGVWDTGSFLENLQTEEVLYFPTEVDVRMNWDVNQNVDLGG